MRADLKAMKVIFIVAGKEIKDLVMYNGNRSAVYVICRNKGYTAEKYKQEIARLVLGVFCHDEQGMIKYDIEKLMKELNSMYYDRFGNDYCLPCPEFAKIFEEIEEAPRKYNRS